MMVLITRVQMKNMMGMMMITECRGGQARCRCRVAVGQVRTQAGSDGAQL